MIAGDRQDFAIEWEAEDLHGYAPLKMGIVRLWVCGYQIGSFDATVIMSVVWSHFAWFLQSTGIRRDDNLAKLSPEEALSTVSRGTFGNADYDLSNPVNYSSFILCPGGGEPFDGFLAIYQEIDDGLARLAWKDDEHESVTECVLRQGVLESAMREFTNWCEASGNGQRGWRESTLFGDRKIVKYKDFITAVKNTNTLASVVEDFVREKDGCSLRFTRVIDTMPIIDDMPDNIALTQLSFDLYESWIQDWKRGGASFPYVSPPILAMQMDFLKTGDIPGIYVRLVDEGSTDFGSDFMKSGYASHLPDLLACQARIRHMQPFIYRQSWLFLSNEVGKWVQANAKSMYAALPTDCQIEMLTILIRNLASSAEDFYKIKYGTGEVVTLDPRVAVMNDLIVVASRELSDKLTRPSYQDSGSFVDNLFFRASRGDCYLQLLYAVALLIPYMARELNRDKIPVPLSG